MSTTDILNSIKQFSIAERIQLIEQILKTIREEEVVKGSVGDTSAYSGKSLLEFAGILNETEADQMKEAISESRQIDSDGW